MHVLLHPRHSLAARLNSKTPVRVARLARSPQPAARATRLLSNRCPKRCPSELIIVCASLLSLLLLTPDAFHDDRTNNDAIDAFREACSTLLYGRLHRQQGQARPSD